MRHEQEGRAVWRRHDLVTDHTWELTLSAAQRTAIIDAARNAARTGVGLHGLTPTTFPLPGMDDDLAGWSTELAAGRGLLLVHGFPVDELDEQEAELAYLGLGTHLGRPVGQNKDAELLTHIRDERLPATAGPVRLYRTRERQDFHTDAADIIGLLCLHRARRGGESKVVSSWALYNEMLATRPDLLDALSQPVGWDRQGDVPPGEAPWFLLQPLTDVGGVPRLFYVGWYIRDSQQHADAPRLTPL